LRLADRFDTVKSDYLIKLIGSSQLLEHHQTLEEGLTELARLSADLLKVERCSIMLLCPADEDGETRLQIYSHHGRLPAAALRESMPLSQGIAGHVLRTGEPLFLADVEKSAFAGLARGHGHSAPSLICAPIRVTRDPIGVINVSDPLPGRPLTSDDLGLVQVFALVIGQSIQTFQLQRLAESRLLQMAALHDARERSGASGRPISPDPARLAKLVAKNFFRELRDAGFGPNAVIAVASEVLSMLNETLAKHKERRERESAAAGDRDRA
jgi:GAF domain-containing protein